jgi:hypothetical protein
MYWEGPPLARDGEVRILSALVQTEKYQILVVQHGDIERPTVLKSEVGACVPRFGELSQTLFWL